jgi:exopolysaccharide production protein ExoQ
MPPSLALILCSAFVLFLVRLERRESDGVSAALWIPTVWMLTIASKPLPYWFGMAGADNESGSILDRLALIGLSAAGATVLARRRYDWSGALRRHGWLLTLLAYMFVSTLWSDIGLIALRRCMREVIVLIMALVIMSEANPRLALESLLRRFAYILIPFSLMLIRYYPALGVEYAPWSGEKAWVGVAGQKNSLGRVCLMGAFFLFWALYRHWRGRPAGRRHQLWADVTVLLIALFLLKGAESYSATSVGVLAVGTATLLGLAWLRKRHFLVPKAGLLALVIVLIGFGVWGPFSGGWNIGTVSSSLGRDATLTGRTAIWAELLPVVMAQPVLGSGYGSFWTTPRQALYRVPNGHNGYLDVLLELGAMGLVLYTAWLLSCAGRLHDALAEHYEWASLAICFLIMALVYNYTESALDGLTHPMTAVMVLASMGVASEPTRSFDRSHPRLNPRVPPQRVAGESVAQSSLPKGRGPLRILDPHRRQSRRRPQKDRGQT